MITQIQPSPNSHIESIVYDSDTLSLSVQYPGSRVYRYKQVPEDVLGDLQQADSTGKFIEIFIKGSYEVERVS